MRFLRKIDKEDDSLILRGKSFHKRQIRIKQGLLMSFCPTKRDI